MLTAQDIVSREICTCASSLIYTLANATGSISNRIGSGAELFDLVEQASELAAPIDDWEEAAIQDGWTLTATESDRALVFTHTDGRVNRNTTWGELCDEQGLEPYQREVFEHWIVTDWLADKLIEQGEKVDKDFAGLCIWARTTTGQAIYADAVMERIAASLNRVLDERDTELVAEELTDDDNPTQAAWLKAYSNGR